MLVIGSSTSIAIVLGIIRLKVLALLLGPGGVGIIGIFENILQTSQQFCGLGLDQSGVRRVAASQEDPRELSRVRRTLVTANLVQGVFGMVSLWLLRHRISLWMFNNPDYGLEVGLLGLGILLSLIAASHMAQLQGMRRIDDLAKATVATGILTTAGGITAVWLLGTDGLVIFVLAQPAILALVAARYAARLPRVAVSMDFAAMYRQWRSMIQLGMTFMLASLLAIGGLLIARALIVDRLTLDAAGQFQAAWAIAMHSIGFVLGAMAADYFPRLSGIIDNRRASTDLVNDQAQIGIALAAPVLLIVLGLAPWMIPLFYSSGFDPAVGVLQWLCVGNLLRLAAWPTGFILIAREDRLVLIAIQVLLQAVFLSLLWVLIPALGVEAAGTAFVASSLVAVLASSWAVWRLHGFRWQGLSSRLFAVHLGLSVALMAIAKAAPIAGAAASVAIGAATGIWGLRLVAIKIGPEGKLAQLATLVFRVLQWPLPDTRTTSEPIHPGAGE